MDAWPCCRGGKASSVENNGLAARLLWVRHRIESDARPILCRPELVDMPWGDIG